MKQKHLIPDDHIFRNDRGQVVGVIRTNDGVDRFYTVKSNNDYSSVSVQYDNSVVKGATGNGQRNFDALTSPQKSTVADYQRSGRSTSEGLVSKADIRGNGTANTGNGTTTVSASLLSSANTSASSGSLPSTGNNRDVTVYGTSEAGKTKVVTDQSVRPPASDTPLVMANVPSSTVNTLNSMNQNSTVTLPSNQLQFNANLSMPTPNLTAAQQKQVTELQPQERQLTNNNGNVINHRMQ